MTMSQDAERNTVCDGLMASHDQLLHPSLFGAFTKRFNFTSALQT